jgi:hypothetical protein
MNAKSAESAAGAPEHNKQGDSMNDPSGFAKLVPGFDFLQGLVKNAGAALPGIGQWVAPTIDPAELEKRIEELRTVQFWLEQNARMLGATIQALEVQRMTLSTLKTMNVQMEDLRDSMQIRVPVASPSTSKSAAAAPEAAPAQPAEAEPVEAKATKGAPVAGVVDPLQWWGALTKQFTELATTAMKDTSTDAARKLAGEMVKKSFDTASQHLKKITPTAAAKPLRKAASKGAAKTSAKRATRKKPVSAR